MDFDLMDSTTCTHEICTITTMLIELCCDSILGNETKFVLIDVNLVCWCFVLDLIDLCDVKKRKLITLKTVECWLKLRKQIKLIKLPKRMNGNQCNTYRLSCEWATNHSFRTCRTMHACACLMSNIGWFFFFHFLVEMLCPCIAETIISASCLNDIISHSALSFIHNSLCDDILGVFFLVSSLFFCIGIDTLHPLVSVWHICFSFAWQLCQRSVCRHSYLKCSQFKKSEVISYMN